MHAALMRDQRLRWAGFVIDAHLASGTRFWRIAPRGIMSFTAEECDTIIDTLYESGFRRKEQGLWFYEDTGPSELFTIGGALDMAVRMQGVLARHGG